MKCNYCGRTNHADAEFCRGCGAPLEERIGSMDLFTNPYPRTLGTIGFSNLSTAVPKLGKSYTCKNCGKYDQFIGDITCRHCGYTR